MPLPQGLALNNSDDGDRKPSLNSDKESSPFLDSPTEHGDSHTYWKHERRGRRPSWLVYIVTIALTALFSSVLTALVMRKIDDDQCQHMGDRPLLDRYVPPDSPLLEIDRTVSTEVFQPWNFTPSVWNEHPSLGRVDALWAEKLGIKGKDPYHGPGQSSRANDEADHFFMIPIDRGAPYGLDPRTHVVLKDMPGPVSHGFPVMLESVHHLHCLVRGIEACSFSPTDH
jgi:hypothetical protein